MAQNHRLTVLGLVAAVLGRRHSPVTRGGQPALPSLPRPRAILVLTALSAFGCAPGSSAHRADTALADTLRQLIQDAYDFSQPDVVTRMTSLYPDTGRVISASGGRIIASADSLRRGIATFWEAAGRNMRNPQWQWGDVHVDRLAADAAVLTATWSIPHIAPDGQPHVISGAWTAVFRRLDGRWTIVQEHLSTP